jgi:hypothetical protein
MVRCVELEMAEAVAALKAEYTRASDQLESEQGAKMQVRCQHCALKLRRCPVSLSVGHAHQPPHFLICMLRCTRLRTSSCFVIASCSLWVYHNEYQQPP